jgi:alanyl-tRNA synthetase
VRVKDLRVSFIEYFTSRNHRHVHSSPLIPKDDPTLLFTTAGMVQFKPLFSGTVEADYTCATSIQKCLRTSDLENVGRTKRHCTFFEMLGNFSFGDYFKREAIQMAWEYSVDVLKLDEWKIWVSVYQDDDEAFDIWNKEVGVPAERIVRLGKEDNFWGPAGDSGACGPCSELYIDKGEENGCGSADCKPGCDCDRFMEYWNLVFNQFNQDTSGNLLPLPKTGIDTGMGLERLATITQNVSSIYETDEFKQMIEFVCSSLKIEYTGKNRLPVNVIVEHARALTFAMADGAYPSNEGRGYVLRRILRRALRFARTLGVDEPFIYSVVDVVVDIFGEFYPEIISASKNVKKVLEGEERRFLETLENGMQKIEQLIALAKKNKSVLSGSDAFQLYDTFGFPIEMTTEMAQEEGVSVDMEAFHNEMEKQRQRGKESWKAADGSHERLMGELTGKVVDTVFAGYSDYTTDSVITALASSDEIVNELSEGEEGYILLDKTPFYGESGGQVGDHGYIEGETFRAEVYDTKKSGGVIIHHVKIVSGNCRCKEAVHAGIDQIRRALIKANHTVTHLLQAALRQVLGDHVKQSGSFVEAERMRFDFTHFEAMSDKQLVDVENLVNRKIWENLEVTTLEMPIKEALALGAMAEFGEKYGSTVRVVASGDFSMELCGGTHVSRTSEIGIFKVMKESSPGAGIRRIEGITLKGVLDRVHYLEDLKNSIVQVSGANEINVIEKISTLVEENAQLRKEIAGLKKADLASGIDDIIADAVKIGDVSVIVQRFDDADNDTLRNSADLIRQKCADSVVFAASVAGGKVILLCAATKSAVQAGIDCGAIIKAAAPIVGGGGGGRKDMAQAGGKNPENTDELLQKVTGLIAEQLKS